MPELEAACGMWLLPGGVVRLWLIGFAALLLLALTRLRYATGGALRILSIAVAAHAVLSAIATGIVADVAAKHQNPSAALEAMGIALSACGLVGILGCWLGRSWTPRARSGQEPPEEIDSRREVRLVIRGILWLLLLLVLFACSAPIWIPGLLLLLLLDRSEPFRWTPQSLELTYLVLAVLAVLAYVWLSTGKRGALRAPVSASVALWLSLTCSVFALAAPSVFSSFFEPAREILHDRVLIQLLAEAVARDAVDSFEAEKRELLRRPSDRAHGLEMASRELRRNSAGSSAMSARLAALDPPPSYPGSPCVPIAFESRHLPRFLPPELAVIDVLLARGATQEALAWLTDPEVPLGLRIQLVEHWPREQPLPRLSWLASFGKGCATVPHDQTITVAPRSYSGACTACGATIYSLLPPEASAITAEQGYATGFALLAMSEPFRGDDHPWSDLSDEVAVAMLRGMYAAQRSKPGRGVSATSFLSCPTFQRLAALVCSAEQGSDCMNFNPSLDLLLACVAHLPAPPPELVQLGGY